MLDVEFINKWLDKLKTYWMNKDIEGATSLFTETEFYQETPFMAPFSNFDEIVKEWRHVEHEDIKKIGLKLLAIDGDTVIVEWYLEQNDDVYDGIYEIKFNSDLKCMYFKSWEMKK